MFCYATLYGLIFTSQMDPALLKKIHHHTGKCFFLSLIPIKLSPPKKCFSLCFQVPLTIINGPELTKEMHQQILLLPLLGKSILHHFLQSLSKTHIPISKQFIKDKKMQLHISCHVTGTDLQPYITAAAKVPTSLQYWTAAFSHLSVKPPEANYLNHMFVNTAFKTPHTASGSQKNCNCQWSLQSTAETC